MVAPRPFQKRGNFAARSRLGECRDLVHEVGDGLTRADHLHFGIEVRPARVAEQRRLLGAQRQNLAQQHVVGRPRTVEELHLQFAARLRIDCERPERDRIGVVGGDRDESVLAGRVRVDVVLRESGETLGCDADRADVVADVARELLPQDGQALRDLLEPVASCLVLVDPAAPEITQSALKQAALIAGKPGRINRGEDGEEFGVLSTLSAVDRGLLQLVLGE